MNEIQFLRTQLTTEHRHLEAVLDACTKAIASTQPHTDTNAFLRICAEYLLAAAKTLTARDRARLGLHYARTGPADQDPGVAKLESLLSAASTQWAALEAALDTQDLVPTLHRATQALGQYLRQREAARECLDDSSYTVEQWRKAAFIDAGSIVEERKRYQRVEAALPLGVHEMDRHGH